MGTYRQPAQLIDKSFESFNKSFNAANDKREALAAAKRKQDQAYAQKLALNAQKNKQKQQLAEIRQDPKDDKLVLETQTSINAFRENQDVPVGIAIDYDWDGDVNTAVTSKVIGGNDWKQQKELLENHRKYYTSAVHNGDGNYQYVGDNLDTKEIETDYTVNFQGKDLKFIENAIIKQKGKDELGNEVVKDAKLGAWYNEYIETHGEPPAGIGIKGSMDLQINKLAEMLKYPVGSIQHTEATQGLNSAKTQIPNLLAFMDAAAEDNKGLLILNSEGKWEMAPTNEANSVLFEENPAFKGKLNAIMDWNNGNADHRFSMDISKAGTTLTYFNPVVMDKPLAIPYKDLQNASKKSGQPFLATLNQKTFDEFGKNLDAGLDGQNLKPIKITEGSSGQYTKDGSTKTLTKKEVIEDFTKLNEESLQYIQELIYSSDRETNNGARGTGGFQSTSAQNNWQFIRKPDSNLPVNWQNTPEQQDAVVDYYYSKKEQNNRTISNYSNLKITPEDEADVVVKGAALIDDKSSGIATSISLEPWGFKNKDGRYTGSEIITHFDKLSNNKDSTGQTGIATLLNGVLKRNSSSKYDPGNPTYMTGTYLKRKLPNQKGLKDNQLYIKTNGGKGIRAIEISDWKSLMKQIQILDSGITPKNMTKFIEDIEATGIKTDDNSDVAVVEENAENMTAENLLNFIKRPQQA
tara:strand:+ start:218 stop:2293 length:2076 start_codon:yes stop_codon:yes gene_type:complete